MSSPAVWATTTEAKAVVEIALPAVEVVIMVVAVAMFFTECLPNTVLGLGDIKLNFTSIQPAGDPAEKTHTSF